MAPTPYQVTFATVVELETAVEDLTKGAAHWATLGLPERIALLQRTHRCTADAAQEWAGAAVAAKGTPLGPWEGEEWISGPYAALAGLGAAVQSLSLIAEGRSPLDGVRSGRAPGERTKFIVMPANPLEWTLFHGFTGEVWLEPGITADRARADAGLGAKRLGENGGVGLVLGAGNISAIGPLDVLYELVAYNRVSILKLNPTFGSLLGAYEKAFAPLIEANLLRIVNGGAEVGSHLTAHAGIDHVHITGSGITHDLIVWGSSADKTGAPKLDKPITSELGGVSPVIVIPGRWSEADLRYQAEQIATQRLQNSGHNCIATQIVILSGDWPQKQEFLAELRRVLDTLPKRESWYPGTDRKLTAATTSYPEAEVHAGRLLVEVTDTTSQDLFTTEYFGPVLGHTTLPGIGSEFFRAAVEFANTRLDGTLGASIAVAPADRRAMGREFDEILAALHYGSIGVNVWSAIAFLGAPFTWGAYPGNTLDDVGSGIGVVHNSHLIADTERSVIYGPFRPFPRSVLHGEASLFPKPPWFVTAKTAKSTNQRLTRFAAAPSWFKLPGIFGDAFRG
ncbi:aldehyde dehydrogenase family protein [Tsukamurella soli]|uniref:Aldehyde dehydrogenase family protein n=1 Tax=Tsukamurella soli TaxID=644556 RepID=A0ABP8JX08_9ACTN